MSFRTLLCSSSFLCLFILFLLAILSTDSNLTEARGTLCPIILNKLLGNDKSCDKVTCKTSLDASSCGKETDLSKRTEFMENIVMCGCCPACVRRVELKENEECVKPQYEDCPEKICPVIISQCSPGLVCSPVTNACVKMDELGDDQECEKKRILAKIEKWEHWTPNCNPDGSYAPVQCKGEINDINSMCFCTDRKGERILGRRMWTKENLQNMTCACSVHAHELKSTKELISTIHCTLDGSYESLQCDTDSGLCYCVHPMTGELTGAVMPEKHWKSLPCYSASAHGSQYLRQCESLWAATQRIKREALLHGLELGNYREISCDYDGSYKAYQIAENDLVHCVYKNGMQIGNYARTHGGRDPMNCRCARSPSDYTMEGLNYPGDRKCVTDGQVGEFENIISQGEFASCVDADGFIYYQIPKLNMCCLLPQDECTSSALSAQCSAMGGPYKRCNEIIH